MEKGGAGISLYFVDRTYKEFRDN